MVQKLKLAREGLICPETYAIITDFLMTGGLRRPLPKMMITKDDDDQSLQSSLSGQPESSYDKQLEQQPHKLRSKHILSA